MSAVKRLYYYLEKQVVSHKINPIWAQYLRKTVGSAGSQDLAEDYLTLLKATKQYRDLLQSYNIGERRDSKKEVENVARRVGLSMPLVKPRK